MADAQDLLRLAESPVPAKDMAAIYVMLSDDSQYIRKWSRKPFDGATAFYAAGFPVSATPAPDSEKLREEVKRMEQYSVHVGYDNRGDFVWEDCVSRTEVLAALGASL